METEWIQNVVYNGMNKIIYLFIHSFIHKVQFFVKGELFLDELSG
jgi:hypothetical protein